MLLICHQKRERANADAAVLDLFVAAVQQQSVRSRIASYSRSAPNRIVAQGFKALIGPGQSDGAFKAVLEKMWQDVLRSRPRQVYPTQASYLVDNKTVVFTNKRGTEWIHAICLRRDSCHLLRFPQRL